MKPRYTMSLHLRSLLELMLISVLLTTSVAAVEPPTPKSQRPNFLVIMVDDLGPEWLGCYGSDESITPHIDRLAEAGTRLTNFYSMPVCTPTRVTLLTGQYPFRHGWVDHWDVPRWGRGCHFDPAEHVTFPQLLQAAGYATAIAGKWQVNDFRVEADVLRRHGFDDWCMWTGYETGNSASGKRYWDPYVHTSAGSRTRNDKFGPDVFTDFLIDFVRVHRDQPLLVYYPMVLTHGPFTDTPAERGVGGNDAAGKLARHRAMVRYTDHLAGRLINTLDELNLRDNTYVLLLTDNGTAGSITGSRHGHKTRGGKNSLREPGMNVPLIVSRPGTMPAGVTSDALADMSDLYPTICDLAGVAVPASWHVDGHSLAPLLTGTADDSKRDWILAMGQGFARPTAAGPRPARPHANRVIRNKRYKLWIEDAAPTRLFDLRADPTEAHNLIDTDDAQTRRLREELIAVWRAQPAQDALRRYTPTPPQAWDIPLRDTDR
jgi:arylsulfatase A-like enzyme